MSAVVDTSVVIVGGSIVGLCGALFLSQHHVPFILIERHPGSSLHPRALGYTSRTMELFRVLGVDKELPQLPSGLARGPRRVETNTLNGQWSEETLRTKTKGTVKPSGDQELLSRRHPGLACQT
jgi:putative polyketide hydroxylase